MNKIEWNELLPKVVECYFKKPLLDNLFHKYLSSTHVGKLFFIFNIIFQYVFFFHLTLFYFFEQVHLIFFRRRVHLILLFF